MDAERKNRGDKREGSASPQATPSEKEREVLLGALTGFGGTKKKDPGTPPRHPVIAKSSASRHHDRTVSWDLYADPLLQPPDIVKMNNPSGESLSGVSLREVLSAAPMEDAAETYIQQSLEESDPTRAGISETQQSLLGGVPDEARNRFEEAEETTDGGLKGRTLADLAKKMRTMQDRRSSVYESIHDTSGMTSTDLFAANAVTLLKRAQSNRKEESETQSAETEVPKKQDAASKWKALRQQVQVVGAAKLAGKKNDDVDEEVGMEEERPEEEQAYSNSARNTKKAGKLGRAKEVIKSEYHDFEEWVRFSRQGIYDYIKAVLMWSILPSTGVAAILFYLTNNPPCGTREQCIAQQLSITNANITNATDTGNSLLALFSKNRSDVASISWWLLFLGVRQVLTLSLARATQAWMVDFLALRTRWFVKIFGSRMTLLLVQAKGWPFILFWWGVYDLCFLYGDNPFARHWLYWQNLIGFVSETNPSGSVTSAQQYKNILAVMIAVGGVVAIKRFYVGLILGRQTFSRYAGELEEVMRKALLIGQVATLARDLEKQRFILDDFGIEQSNTYNDILITQPGDASQDDSNLRGPTALNSAKSSASVATVTDQRDKKLLNFDLNRSQRMKINELLGEWEEPQLTGTNAQDVTIASIIQFRQSLSCLNTPFPFSVAFGPADSREQCVRSLEKVYFRLMSSHPERKILSFDAIALAAIRSDGELDIGTLKELIQIFRPDREGNLTLLDFAKSIDAVYKELRLLRASVANSSKMDKAFERILNIIFYFILGCIVLAVVGIDPFIIFASVSGFILGFAFMIGAACSKYFEGLLFILVRKPYDIGDRINVNSPCTDTSGTGSPGWIVKDVDLYSSTIVYGSTNETATVSNGSLAGFRVINHARSPQALLWFMLKFSIDSSPYGKIKIFKSAVEKFIKDRPREWVAFIAMRATRVEADLGFVEYIVIATHRESWQNIGAVKSSLAEVQTFCLELSKKMDMRYKSPPLPVDLRMASGDDVINIPASAVPNNEHQRSDDASQTSYSVDVSAVANLFEKK